MGMGKGISEAWEAGLCLYSNQNLFFFDFFFLSFFLSMSTSCLFSWILVYKLVMGLLLLMALVVVCSTFFVQSKNVAFVNLIMAMA